MAKKMLSESEVRELTRESLQEEQESYDEKFENSQLELQEVASEPISTIAWYIEKRVCKYAELLETKTITDTQDLKVEFEKLYELRPVASLKSVFEKEYQFYFAS